MFPIISEVHFWTITHKGFVYTLTLYPRIHRLNDLLFRLVTYEFSNRSTCSWVASCVLKSVSHRICLYVSRTTIAPYRDALDSKFVFGKNSPTFNSAIFWGLLMHVVAQRNVEMITKDLRTNDLGISTCPTSTGNKQQRLWPSSHLGHHNIVPCRSGDYGLGHRQMACSD